MKDVLKEVDVNLNTRKEALRLKFEADTKALEEWTESNSQDLRQCLRDTEKKLDLEKAFVATIRRIPPEILIEIFKWHLEDGPPTQCLALVCREWKVLLVDTPSLWRNIKAYYTNSSETQTAHRTLEIRIQRSRSCLLNITLDFSNYSMSKHSDLFGLVTGIRLERWRSLTLLGGRGFSTTLPKIKQLDGTFSALESFRIVGVVDTGQDLCSSLFKSMVSTSRNIKEAYFDADPPSSLYVSPIFRNALRVCGSIDTISNLSPLRNLQSLSITGFNIIDRDFSSLSLPSLPKQTKFSCPLSAGQLSAFSLHQVEELELSNWSTRTSTYFIDIPELVSLSITDGDLFSLKYIRASKLKRLSIKKNYYRRRYSCQASTNKIIVLFRDEPQAICIAPLSLNINLELSPRALVTLLQNWPQLQDLTLAFGKELPWEGFFSAQLKKRTNPLCPNLVTLRLVPGARVRGDEWKKTARDILDSRRGLPLTSIEWVPISGTTQRVC